MSPSLSVRTACLLAAVLVGSESCALLQGGGQKTEYCVYDVKNVVNCDLKGCTESDETHWANTRAVAVRGKRILIEGTGYRCVDGSTDSCPAVVFYPVLGSQGDCQGRRMGVVEYEKVAGTCATGVGKGIETAFKPREVSASGACN